MDTALTHEERRQLLEVLQQLDPSAPHERRRDLRRKALVNLWIRKISKGRSQAPLQLVLVNVSPGGAGFLGKASLAVGDTFTLQLRFDEGGGWLVLCRVKNSRKLQNGHYKVGVSFVDRVDDPGGDSRIPGDWLV